MNQSREERFTRSERWDDSGYVAEKLSSGDRLGMASRNRVGPADHSDRSRLCDHFFELEP